MNKLYKAYAYFLDRLAEQSTWQGIGFFIGLATGKGLGCDWGQAAAIGGMVSGILKSFLPDKTNESSSN